MRLNILQSELCTPKITLHSLLYIVRSEKSQADANNPFQLLFDFVFYFRNIMLENKLVI